MLRDTVKTYDQVYIVVDALNECQDARFLLTKLSSVLSDINVSEIHRLLGMVTCRPIPENVGHFRGCSMLEIKAVDADINMYLEYQISLCLPDWKEERRVQHSCARGVAKSVDGL